MKYSMIRGPKQKDRCTDPVDRLYCDCGCQKPHSDDPQIDLSGVIVSGRAWNGYADYTLTRNGKPCGTFNTQYCAITIDGHEYLGCDRTEMEPIRSQIFDEGVNRFPRDNDTQAGGTLAETAAAVKVAEKCELSEQDSRYKDHPGYCNQCHSFCYGDCEAN